MAQAFQTPINEKSFSGLIDGVVLATGKPGSLISITQFANAVIRECQALGLFAQDMIEDTLIVPSTQTTAYTWTRPAFFRSLRTVKYVAANVYPKFIKPGRKALDECNFYYAADNYFVFSGAKAGENINYATYYWSAPLAYYGRNGVVTTSFPGGPYNTRLAYYDIAAGVWYYWTGSTYALTTGVPATDTVYQKLSTNWLVDQWWDLILSGTKAKQFNAAGDPRAGAEFSSYKNMQKLLQNTSGDETEGF